MVHVSYSSRFGHRVHNHSEKHQKKGKGRIGRARHREGNKEGISKGEEATLPRSLEYAVERPWLGSAVKPT